jgi:hypothetical protein
LKLLPRFSLRFAWLALTIFLIVFAVVVSYWRAYQAHLAIAERLLHPGWHVEEEPITLWGYFVGKRLTGLLHESVAPTELQPLLEIPSPVDLRRLAIRLQSKDQPLSEALLAKVEQCTALERLHLRAQFNYGIPQQTLERAQTDRLAKLQQLRVLDLGFYDIAPGGLAFFEQLPKLEILLLQHTRFDQKEFLKLQLPRLRVLNFSGNAPVLPLTRAGLGRFPQLEMLFLDYASFTKVECEAGALPRLRHLDLALQDKACDIAWELLPETAPQLASLALHLDQYQTAADRSLRRCVNLNHVHFHHVNANGEFDRVIPMDWRRINGEAVPIYETNEPLLQAWLTRRPQTKFYGSYNSFYQAIFPPELIYNGSLQMEWPDAQWRSRSSTRSGGLF